VEKRRGKRKAPKRFLSTELFEIFPLLAKCIPCVSCSEEWKHGCAENVKSWKPLLQY